MPVHSAPYFRSRRIVKGSTARPWLQRKDPRDKWLTIIPLLGVVLGIVVGGYLIWDGVRGVVKQSYCLVLDEDWSAGFDDKVWLKEVEVGGFGNGEFTETTSSEENAFLRNGMLHLKPTLQKEKLIATNGSSINLLNTTCTSSRWSDCVATTNLSNGTIVPPAKSARVSSRGSKIRYGRVEVTARLPQGDWLWPAIWMLPVDYVYGPWPRSGEIDIAESRGNDVEYKLGGSNVVSSALHWGPNANLDGWWRTTVKRAAFHASYADAFHVFGMEWNEEYLFTYVDSRLLQVMYVKFDQPFWLKGQFPLSDSNGTKLEDPWAATGRKDTPFDQDFRLVISLGVGGTNGWFLDGQGGKPWVDRSPNAKLDFWKAREKWFPTWQTGGELIVKSVKMWQQKGYNGCS